MLRTVFFSIFLLSANAVSAGFVAKFDEGAPKDRFSFTNMAACALGPVDLTVDLTGSAGGLVFDVTSEGAGVEVFQPFELVAGGENVLIQPQVMDGDTQMILRLSGLAPRQTVAFTIDVDDTLGQRAITVNDSEITGASVTLAANGQTAGATFDETAVVTVPVSACLS